MKGVITVAAWASITETQAYTGISVGQDNLDAAQFMVELFADVVYGQTASISTKNLRLLKMAVAYQAAWMTDHPDLFTHVDVSSINQDGIFYVQKHDNAYLLAPMARRALARLSWKRNRNIKIRPNTRRVIGKTFQGLDGDFEQIESYNYHTPVEDDHVGWDSA